MIYFVILYINYSFFCAKITIMSKRYTDKDKVRVLKLLQMNDFNYSKTSKATGIRYETLKKWQNQMGEEVNKPNRMEKIIKRVEGELAEKEKEFLNDVYETKMQALQQLKEMIPQEKNMDNITKALRLLIEITDGKLSKEDQEELLGKGQTFFQIIHQQLITQNANKDITTGRNTEKPS